jgi:hypothetical protein
VDLNIGKELAALQRLTVKELRARYADVYGEETSANNKGWLIKRIVWRLQVRAEGDLSERARQRAAELADDAHLRLNPPKAKLADGAEERTVSRVLRTKSDERLPPPGSIITRPYKGESLQVKVLPNGFEYAGEVYLSLSAVAKAITGSHCNGYLFFRLNEKGGDE